MVNQPFKNKKQNSWVVRWQTSHKDTHKIKAFGLEIQWKFNENHNKDHKSVPFVLVEGKLAEKLS